MTFLQGNLSLWSPLSSFDPFLPRTSLIEEGAQGLGRDRSAQLTTQRTAQHRASSQVSKIAPLTNPG